LPSDSQVPFRWPSDWADPALLRLIEGSPINCVVLEGSAEGAVADAARKAGLTVLAADALKSAPLAEIKWDSPSPRIAISGLVWPRIKMSSASPRSADAGPTGAPWIDSNCWVARLARVRAPGKPIWLDFQKGKDDPILTAASYRVAIADSAASGARWIVSLDDDLSKGLARGDGDSLKTWGSVQATLTFFQKVAAWNFWEPWGTLGVLSTFAGKDEFMGQEFLNLAARGNLLYRIMDRALPATHKTDGLRAVVYVDNEAPTAELKTKLLAFARGGGLLILPKAIAAGFPGEKPMQCPVSGYDLKSFGKGSIASAMRDWEDPFFLAADVHDLVSRQNDPVCLFNVRTIWEHYAVAPDAKSSVLQLVAFTSRTNGLVSVAVKQPSRGATMYAPEFDAPKTLQPVIVEGRTEYHLPAFSLYAALEFKS